MRALLCAAGKRNPRKSAPNDRMAQATKPKSTWRGAALRIGGSVAMLSLLLWILPVDQLWVAIRRVPPGLFIGVLMLYLMAHTMAAGKWRMMVNLAGAGLNFPQAAQCYFSGLFGNVFLPSIVGGDVVRAGLALRWGKNRAGTLFGSLLDRLLDIASLGVLAGMGALFIPGALDAQSRSVFWMLTAVFVLGGAAGLALLLLTPVRKFPFKVRRKLARLRHAMRSMARQPHRVAFALLLAIVIQGSLAVLTAVLAKPCGLDLPLRVWLFAWPLAKVAALLPLTQGGIGVREAALAGLLLPFGAPAVLSVAVGLVWEVVLVIGGLIGGMTAAMLSRVNDRRPVARRERAGA